MSEISFIIKTIIRKECLEKLLCSIREFYPDNPILVMDDSPSPYPEVSERYGAQHFICNEEIGASAAYNFLLKKVETKYVCMLDDDFIFTEDTKVEDFVPWIESGLADLVGGSVLDFRHNYSRRYELNIDWHERTLYTIPEKKIGPFRCDVVLNFWVGKTCCVRNAGWDDDQKLYRHLDFFMRARMHRMKVMHLPSVVVHHDPVRPSMDYGALRHGRMNQFILMFMNKWNLDTIYDKNKTYRRDHLEH